MNYNNYFMESSKGLKDRRKSVSDSMRQLIIVTTSTIINTGQAS